MGFMPRLRKGEGKRERKKGEEGKEKERLERE